MYIKFDTSFGAHSESQCLLLTRVACVNATNATNSFSRTFVAFQLGFPLLFDNWWPVSLIHLDHSFVVGGGKCEHLGVQFLRSSAQSTTDWATTIPTNLISLINKKMIWQHFLHLCGMIMWSEWLPWIAGHSFKAQAVIRALFRRTLTLTANRNWCLLVWSCMDQTPGGNWTI